MQPRAVAGRRLDRVAKCVPEVERRADVIELLLIRSDDLSLEKSAE